MKRLALLTPDPADDSLADRWKPSLARYLALFAALRVEAVPIPWTEPLSGFDAATPLLAWGYHRQAPRWQAVLHNTSINMINPSSVLLWNTTKTYLEGLGEAGVSVVPTQAFSAPTPADVAAAFDHFGTDTVVVKPQVSAGSHLTRRTHRGEACVPPACPVLVQPFLEAVSGEGELSLFFFGGRFSHAARKVATGGDFRIQPQFGGAFSRFDPDDEAMDLARATLAAAPDGIVYARVDMIRLASGALALMELEAIEPDLYLDLAPDGGAAFADAVLEAL